MQFAYPHGPFPAGLYSCILCVSGEGNSYNATPQEGLGWMQDGDASRISGIKLDLGGNSNIFGYYTVSSQERAELLDTRGGPACGTDCADVFYDRSESPYGNGANANSGTTRPVIRDFNMAAETTSACTSCYGIVFEGSDYLVQLTQGSCDTQPLAYVNSVTSGASPTLTLKIVNNGGGNCDNHSNNPGCTIQSAPVSFTVSSSTPHTLSGMTYPSYTCTPTFSGSPHVINGFNLTVPMGSKLNPSFFTGGPLFEDINIDPANTFVNGIWVEGVSNAEISKVHCLNLSDSCVSFGGETPSYMSPPTAAVTIAGILRNIDYNSGAFGTVTLGYGIDNGQTLNSITSGGTNLIRDLYNGQTLSVMSYGNSLNQYTPGSAPPVVGGIGQQGGNAPTALTVIGGSGGSAIPQETGNGTIGGGISLSTGAGSMGGTSSGTGGSGGTLNVTTGSGGIAPLTSTGNGGPGGLIELIAGNGANASPTGAGGSGGAITILTGTGSSGGTTSGNGGSGGNFSVTGANGGSANGSSTGGNGGVLSLNGGAGGNASSSGTAGNGGSIILTPGLPGTTTGTAGAPGNVQIAGRTLGGAFNNPFLSITGTWTTTGIVDAGILEDIQYSGSTAGTALEDLQINNSSVFKVDYKGNVTNTGSLTAGTSGSSGSIGLNGSTSGTATFTAPAIAGTSTNAVISSNNISAPALVSTVATGTAPLQVASTTQVTNLNASSLGGNTLSTPTAQWGIAYASGATNFATTGMLAANALIKSGGSAAPSASSVTDNGVTISSTELLRVGNVCRVTSAVTLTPGTPVTVCSWSLPATALSWSWRCSGLYTLSAGSIPTLKIEMNPSQAPSAMTGAANILSNQSGTSTQATVSSTSSGNTLILTGATNTTANAQFSTFGFLTASATAGTFSITADEGGSISPAGTVNVGTVCTLE